MWCLSFHQRKNEIISARKLQNRCNSTHGRFWSATDFLLSEGGLLKNNGSGDVTTIGGSMI